MGVIRDKGLVSQPLS